MTALELSADIGLVTVWLLTANFLMGLLLGTRYNPWTSWPHRRINYYALHDWTGYVGLCLAILHPVVLLASSTAGFRVIDIVYPVHSPKQPLENTIGAISLYVLVVVVATSYFRRRMKRSAWKTIHFLTYVAVIAFFIHGLLTDPKLENRPTDWLDGEKVSVEVCVLAVAVGSWLRLRYALAHRALRRPPHHLRRRAETTEVGATRT